MSRKKDLTYQKFGKLLVLKEGNKRSKYNQLYWLCLCDCGKTKEILSTSLVQGKSKSCGCVYYKHGHGTKGSPTPTYRSWTSMKARCFNSKYKDYEKYGGNGITVCERWLDFKNFLEDMGERPIGTTIDRIDNTKGYEPENCRWADDYTQSHNRKYKNKSSIYPGVSFHKKYKKWQASIMIKGKRLWLGFFDDEKSASLKYNEILKEIREKHL